MGNFFFRKYENYFNIIHSSNYILMKFSSKRKYYHWDKQIIVIISNTTLYNKYFLISSLTPCWSNLCNNIFLYVPFIIYISWKLRKILSIWLMNSILIYVWFPEPVYLEQKYHSHRKKKGKKITPRMQYAWTHYAFLCVCKFAILLPSSFDLTSRWEPI